MEVIQNKVGRPGNEIIYKKIDYADKKYVIGSVKYNDTTVNFIIDDEDYLKIKDLSWHYISNAYIAHNIAIDGKQKALYLHNMVMNRIEFPGKGSKQTVDHINRNGLDNRKENLRIVTQSEQNGNQKKKSRNIVLPENSGLTADDIPKHIWMSKANGSHGERFVIEFKTENVLWKSTSSKSVSLTDKLNSAKEKLQELHVKYPHLNPDNKEKNDIIQSLTTSYNKIIELVF